MPIWHTMSIARKKPASTRIDWEAVGRRIRELRGFDAKQADFAKRIGVSQAYLSRMEHGQREIGAEVLLRIGSEFEKSIEWLLTGKP